MLTKISVVIQLLLLTPWLTSGTPTRPHIVYIIIDDLGWNDVSFHGSNEIPTPNIDALAYSGIILNNYYVAPLCTPSRSALMTGKYPIHTGMQHDVLHGAEARGLPLSEKLLPQYLQELGYENHMVGKWHLGSYTKEYTPLYRGFKSHLGYWCGHQDYFDHTTVEKTQFGLDMRRNMEVAYDLHGQYSTDIFTSESVKLISNHNTSKPLFLYLAHAAVHAGNTYNPICAKDDNVKAMSHVKGYDRRRFAGVMKSLDESVGKVTQALREKAMLENTIIVFTTDNGGATAGYDLNTASNWPLKGGKNTLWEGGVRGAALLWSPLLKKPSRVAKQRMHLVDWLPTLLDAAGANSSTISEIDGVSLWSSLSENGTFERFEILHNIDDIYGNSALTVGQWKIIKGTTAKGKWDSWFGPSGRNYSFDMNLISKSQSGQALSSIGKLPSEKQMKELRAEGTLKCTPPQNAETDCEPLKETCLFNIEADPCEKVNLARKFPNIVEKLEGILKNYNSTAVKPGNLPLDPRGDPKYHNYIWTNFGDEITTNQL